MMFALGIIDKLTPGCAQRRRGRRRNRHDRRRRQRRADRRHPSEDVRRAGMRAPTGSSRPQSNCDEVVGHIPDGLDVFSVEDARRLARRARGDQLRRRHLRSRALPGLIASHRLAEAFSSRRSVLQRARLGWSSDRAAHRAMRPTRDVQQPQSAPPARRRAAIAITLVVIVAARDRVLRLRGPLRRRALVRPARLPQRADDPVDRRRRDVPHRLPRHGGARLARHPARLPARARCTPSSTAQLDRYQQVIEPLRRLAMCGIPIVFGLFAGVSAASRWETALLWLNGTPYGNDGSAVRPRHRLLPLRPAVLRTLLGFASAVVLICAHRDRWPPLPLRLHPHQRRVRCASPRPRASRSRSSPRSTCCCRPSSLWLDRYTTLTDSNVNDLITGAGYTDVNATIPGRAILAGSRGRRRDPLLRHGLHRPLALPDRRNGAAHRLRARRRRDRTRGSCSASRSSRARRRSRPSTSSATSTSPGTPTASTTSRRSRTTPRPRPSRARCAQDARDHGPDPHHGPRDRQPVVPAARAVPQYYQFPDQLDVDRYKIDGKSRTRWSRCATCSSPARRRPELAELHDRLHARLRPRRRLRQPALDRRPARCSSSRASRRPVRLGETSSRASTSASTRRPTRSSARPRAPKRSSSTTRRAATGESQQTDTTFAGRRRAEARQRLQAARLRAQVPVRADLALGLRSTTTRRSSTTATRIERVQKVAPYLTLDSRPVPDRRRRPHRVDRRRLHDERPTTRTRRRSA